MKNRNSKFKKAFTLPEILVSISIFSVAITLLIPIFINISRSYRAIAGFINAQNNLRFVLESMTREIKEGSDYQNTGTGVFLFTDQDNKKIEYRLKDGVIYRSVSNTTYPLTDNRLKVSDFKAILHCPNNDLTCQPRVTFIIKIEPTSEIDNEKFSSFSFALQTSITQRKLIFPEHDRSLSHPYPSPTPTPSATPSPTPIPTPTRTPTPTPAHDIYFYFPLP